MKITSGSISAICVIFLSLIFLSCNDNDPVTPDYAEIKIGALLSISSGWTSLGINSNAALKLAEDEINTYLETTGADYRIKIIIEDTELVPANALEKLKSFKDQGIQIVIGPQSSSEVNAIKSYADANNILLISQSSTANSLAIAGDNVFRLCPDDLHEGQAVAGIMYSDGIRGAVGISRNDAGNLGLQSATKNYFESYGGTIIQGPTYETNVTNFSAIAAALKTAVTSSVTLHGTAGTAVYLTAFDEAALLFEAVKDDALLSSVKWYGSDGVALSNALIANNGATVFANTVNYYNPIFGLDDAAKDKWEPVINRIKAETNIEVDAFTLAAYDAAWLAVESYIAIGFSDDFSKLKSVFPAVANSFYGASGWTSLNEAGDRKFGNFDFWGICSESGTLKWKRAASFQPVSGGIGNVIHFGCN